MTNLKFIVRNSTRGLEKEFDEADETVLFMWGKDSRFWKIYVRADCLPGDIDGIREALKKL